MATSPAPQRSKPQLHRRIRVLPRRSIFARETLSRLLQFQRVGLQRYCPLPSQRAATPESSGDMDRSSFQQLSKGQVIALALRLQRPDKNSNAIQAAIDGQEGKARELSPWRSEARASAARPPAGRSGRVNNRRHRAPQRRQPLRRHPRRPGLTPEPFTTPPLESEWRWVVALQFSAINIEISAINVDAPSDKAGLAITRAPQDSAPTLADAPSVPWIGSAYNCGEAMRLPDFRDPGRLNTRAGVSLVDSRRGGFD